MYKKNTSDLWFKDFPFPKDSGHKYNRGYVVVSGGAIDCTGAACLAANAALRSGAGLVTVASPLDALVVYACKLTSVMAKPFDGINKFEEFIKDPRKNVVLLGPGNGVGNLTAEKVKISLNLGKHCVIDADAITSFKYNSDELFSLIKAPVVITPHEGEFGAIFDLEGKREDAVIKAAKLSGAVIVLKGHDTIIASPDGKVVVNCNASSALATAGSGDVLSGIIAGLMAQGMDAFLAASCGVWVHSKAADVAGVGMISEDLLPALPLVIKEIYALRGN